MGSPSENPCTTAEAPSYRNELIVAILRVALGRALIDFYPSLLFRRSPRDIVTCGIPECRFVNKPKGAAEGLKAERSLAMQTYAG